MEHQWNVSEGNSIMKEYWLIQHRECKTIALCDILDFQWRINWCFLPLLFHFSRPLLVHSSLSLLQTRTFYSIWRTKSMPLCFISWWWWSILKWANTTGKLWQVIWRSAMRTMRKYTPEAWFMFLFTFFSSQFSEFAGKLSMSITQWCSYNKMWR